MRGQGCGWSQCKFRYVFQCVKIVCAVVGVQCMLSVVVWKRC